MPFTIEKTFRFDAGHRALGFHYKKEETLHGHSWVLRLVIESPGPLDTEKTIFDTNDLALVVKPLIDEVDHSFIVWKQDPLFEAIVALCRQGSIDDKLYPVDFNPTVEGLVEHLFKSVKARLPLRGAVLKRADLDATTTLRASYSE